MDFARRIPRPWRWLSQKTLHALQEGRATASNSAVAAYYRRQVGLVLFYAAASKYDNFAVVPPQEAGYPELDDESLSGRLAERASLLMNVILLLCKATAFALSGSLVVFGSTVESALDVLSAAIFAWAAAHGSKPEPYKFPVGKARLDVLANLAFAACMGGAAIVVASQALQALADGIAGGAGPVSTSIPAIAIIAASVCTKLVLWAVCYSVRHSSMAAASLAADHRNDSASTAFTLVALVVTSLVPSMWWIDPGSAIVMALVIAATWSRAAKSHMELLVGLWAKPVEHSRAISVALLHDTRVRAVEHCSVYTTGEALQVELDVVLPPSMPLQAAHDLIEGCQWKLESLPTVERAYVHPDWRVPYIGEAPEHRAAVRVHQSSRARRKAGLAGPPSQWFSSSSSDTTDTTEVSLASEEVLASDTDSVCGPDKAVSSVMTQPGEADGALQGSVQASPPASAMDEAGAVADDITVGIADVAVDVLPPPGGTPHSAVSAPEPSSMPSAHAAAGVPHGTLRELRTPSWRPPEKRAEPAEDVAQRLAQRIYGVRPDPVTAPKYSVLAPGQAPLRPAHQHGERLSALSPLSESAGGMSKRESLRAQDLRRMLRGVMRVRVDDSSLQAPQPASGETSELSGFAQAADGGDETPELTRRASSVPQSLLLGMVGSPPVADLQVPVPASVHDSVSTGGRERSRSSIGGRRVVGTLPQRQSSNRARRQNSTELQAQDSTRRRHHHHVRVVMEPLEIG